MVVERIDVEKLLKWAGFRCGSRITEVLGNGFEVRLHGVWSPSPNSQFVDDYPDILNSLDECFKWLELPLCERLGIYHIGFARVKGVGYNCYMNRAAIEYPHREEGRSKELMTLGYGKTLGEAFCSAALRVIDRYPELEKGIIEQLREAEVLL